MPSHSSLPYRDPGPIRIAAISYPGFRLLLPVPLRPLQFALAAIAFMVVALGPAWLVLQALTLIIPPSPLRAVPVVLLWWLVLGYLYRLLMQKTAHLRSQETETIGE